MIPAHTSRPAEQARQDALESERGYPVISPTRDAHTSNKQQLAEAIPVPYLWLGWSTMAPEYHGLISAGEIAPWS